MKFQFDIEELVNEVCGEKKNGVIPFSMGVADGPKRYALLDFYKKEFVRGFEFSHMDQIFICGLTVVTEAKTGYHGVLRADGNFLLPPSEEYAEIEIEEEGVIIIKMKKGTYTMISAKDGTPFDVKNIIYVKAIGKCDKVALYEVRVGSNVDYMCGVIRSDGFWVVRPECHKIRLKSDGLVLAEYKDETHLVNSNNGDIILRGKKVWALPCEAPWQVFSYQSADEEGENNISQKLTVIKGGELCNEFEGYSDYYPCVFGIFVKCHTANGRIDIFSLAKNKFVLHKIKADSFIPVGGEPFNYKTYKFEKDGLLGLISETGDVLVEPVATDIYCLYKNYYYVTIGEFTGIFDVKEGNWLLYPQWYYIICERDAGLLWVQTSNGAGPFSNRFWYLYEFNGKPVCNTAFIERGSFNNKGLASVRITKRSKWVKINTKGEIVKP